VVSCPWSVVSRQLSVSASIAGRFAGPRSSVLIPLSCVLGEFNEPTDACENVTNEPIHAEQYAPNEASGADENVTNEPAGGEKKVTNPRNDACENVTDEPNLAAAGEHGQSRFMGWTAGANDEHGGDGDLEASIDPGTFLLPVAAEEMLESYEDELKSIRGRREEEVRKMNEQARREAEAARTARRARRRAQKTKNGKPTDQAEGRAVQSGQKTSNDSVARKTRELEALLKTALGAWEKVYPTSARTTISREGGIEPGKCIK
jgi:hypothetical protein